MYPQVQQFIRLHRAALEWNERARRSFAKSGFTPVKMVRRMSQDFLLMEVLREDWLNKADERSDAQSKLRDKEAPASTSGLQ